MPVSDPIELLRDLVARRSVTPADGGCQARVAECLAPFGFQIRQMPFGDVDNLFAWHGESGPLMVFLGHTDVVPTGPEDQWSSPPFEPTERDGLLYGRGTADMKGSVAAMVTALQRFTEQCPDHPGRVGLLLTSDEEGPAQDGIRRVVPALADEGVTIDWCVVGEPSSQERLGDRIRIGRRGSLNGFLTVRGIQGHAAFPHLARNPIHELAPALSDWCQREWDEGTDGFPATSFQVTNLTSGTGAVNVIPGTVEASINFRFNPASTADSLKQDFESTLKQYCQDYDLRWQHSGDPFLTRRPELREAVIRAVETHCGRVPVADTGGGTSDGRFVAPTGAQVVEIGPINASIHKIDEHVRLEDVVKLASIYQTVAQEVLMQ